MANSASSIDFYDDKKHNYKDFWQGRDYEHFAESIAIRRLLKKKHFQLALDYGGGYGRLIPVVAPYTDKVILSDPAKKQLNIGKEFLKKYKNTEYMLLMEQAKIPLDKSSIDLLLMVRVSHHLIDPAPTFKEISRVLKPGGSAIIEIANYTHAMHKLKYALKGKKLPINPIKVGSHANGAGDETPFVNHNPKTIEKEMKEAGLVVQQKLSVSNLRNKTAKKVLGKRLLLIPERFMQPALAKYNFGPSIFYLVRNDK